MRHVLWAISGAVLLVPRLVRRFLFSLRRPRILKYELAGEVVFQTPARRWFRPSRKVVALDRLDEEWAAIAADAKVRAVIVVLRELRGGYVMATALHERLRKLREKKRVIVYAAHLGNRDLMMVAGATEVALPASARVHLTGIGVEVTHLRGFLAHASVKVEVDAAGKYKGALERFTRDDLSEPQREVLDAILDSWSGDFVSRIADGRGRTAGEVASWVSHGPYTAEAAREAGLIDRVAYEEDVAEEEKSNHGGTPENDREPCAKPENELRESGWCRGSAAQTRSSEEKKNGNGKEARAEAVADAEAGTGAGAGADSGSKRKRAGSAVPVVERGRTGSPIAPRVWPSLRAAEAIAVVTMKGLIHMGASRAFPTLTVGEATVRAAFKRARENRRVRGVLLAIDSGGGSALASDLIWDEVVRTRREKPVVAWMGNVAASGGYYAAAPANEIVASPFTLTGSIGVISGRFILTDLFRRFGVTRTLVARGRFAELDAVGQPLSDEARAIVQAEVADCYERFISRVAEGRSLSLDDVRKLAEGRVYTGRDAAALRLVDHLGDFTLAVERLRLLAKSPRARVVAFDPASPPFARGDRASVLAELELLLDENATPALFETMALAVLCDGAPLALMPDIYAPR